MNILSIETSFDETGISLVSFEQEKDNTSYTILSNMLHSQIDVHQQYGGVVPNLAKQEHAHVIINMLEKVLHQAQEKKGNSPANFLIKKKGGEISLDLEKIKELLHREPETANQIIKLLNHIERPDIDAIAITVGPGLEPALWVGVNVAKVLGEAWNIPVVPVNHMEGHILSAFITSAEVGQKTELEIRGQDFPALALLISGAHTELVIMESIGSYKKIGQTRDDAVGEAFDKVARLLGLPYPGGPEIEKIANKTSNLVITAEAGIQENNDEILNQVQDDKHLDDDVITLPRPMINTDDYDFSLSGLKTAVRYMVQELGDLDENQKSNIANEFQQSVTDVLIKKTMRAVEEHEIKSLIISGGVSANGFIRNSFKNLIEKEYSDVKLLFPIKGLSTDNALMIAFAGYFEFLHNKSPNLDSIRAVGNLSL